jgi:hypothetical protein
LHLSYSCTCYTACPSRYLRSYVTRHIFCIGGSLKCLTEIIVLSRVTGVCDYRRGMNWLLDFIDHFYTPLGTTLSRSLTQSRDLSLLQSPRAVSWQRLLPREIIQLPALRTSCHSRTGRTLVNWQLS